MRGVSSRKLFAVLALVVILLAPSAFADSGSSDPGLWAQFVAWFDGNSTISFEEWLVLMGRIDVPNG
jgi:hypothetical protein